MASKVDTSNQGKWGNSPGWDLVGGGSSSSSAKPSSSGSAGSPHSSDNDHDSGGSSYNRGNGPDMSRRQDLAGQTVRQGMYDVTYDGMGYAKSGRKTSDSPGYIVDGVTYDGNGNIVSGGIGASSVQGNNLTGQSSLSGKYPTYQNMTFQDYLDQSGYSAYQTQMQDYIKAAVDKAVNGYQTQIDTANQDSDKLAQQAYVAKMLGEKNLDQKLSAAGYAGGMADSQRIQSESNYQNNLNDIETQRAATVKQYQQAISDAQLTGDMQTAQALSQQLSSLQSQWSSYIQQQESMNNADYWNQKQLDSNNYWSQKKMDNDNYWQQQGIDTQNQTTARTNAMELLSAGIMPDDDTLNAAGLSQTVASAIRSVYLNGVGGTTGTTTKTETALSSSGGRALTGYNNGSLTTAQVQQLQSKLGVTADGKWGSASSRAAGGLTAEQAWAKYGGGGDTVYVVGRGNVSAEQAETWLNNGSIIQEGYLSNGDPYYAVLNTGDE
jgi:hypothetical protein